MHHHQLPHERNVPLNGLCVVCEQEIRHDDSSIVIERDDLRCSYGVCETCSSAHLTIQIGKGESTTAVSMLTDWKRREVEFFWKQDAISANDVIALHEALSDAHFSAQLVHADNNHITK